VQQIKNAMKVFASLPNSITKGYIRMTNMAAM